MPLLHESPASSYTDFVCNQEIRPRTAPTSSTTIFDPRRNEYVVYPCPALSSETPCHNGSAKILSHLRPEHYQHWAGRWSPYKPYFRTILPLNGDRPPQSQLSSSRQAPSRSNGAGEPKALMDSYHTVLIGKAPAASCIFLFWCNCSL
jgi:hypothetical protein